MSGHAPFQTNQGTEEQSPLLGTLWMAGVNHKTASVQVREALAIPKGTATDLLLALKSELPVGEVVAVSTCNRTEFYWSSSQPIPAAELYGHLPGAGGIEGLDPFLFCHRGEAAVRHLFEVAAGLNSLVVGETQILHQVKRAYERSQTLKLTGGILNPLFQKALQTAKRIHTETTLTAHQASVPSVALEVADAIFDDLSQAFVVIVGTGEIAELTFEALRKRGAKHYAFVSRTEARAREWGERYHAEAYSLDDIDQVLPRADVIVTCTSAAEPVITCQHLENVIRTRPKHHAPLLILDLGVPRNVAEDVQGMENVFLRDVDDLQEVVERHRHLQQSEILAAQEIVDAGVHAYCCECRIQTAAATIREFREQIQQMVNEEVQRSMNKLPDLDDKGQQEVARLAHRILGKMLHAPSEALREASQNGSAPEAIFWARNLFGLSRKKNS